MSSSTLPPQTEIDAQTSSSILVCFNDSGTLVQAYIREFQTINNTTGNIISTETQYSLDGINWSTTPPAGTPTIGGCKGTKVLAVERFFYGSGLSIPASHVAYWGGDTLANSYSNPALDATNVYIHTSLAVVAGNGTNDIGTDLLPYTAGSSQAAVLLTDVATIQAMIDAQMSVMGLTIGDAIYAVTTDNQPVVFLSPAAIALLASSTYLHAYIGETNIANNYDAKISFNTLSPYTSTDVSLTTYNGDCIEVELIKELQTDGTETYRWVTRDGAGLLVPASSIITGFDETLVLTECPKPTPSLGFSLSITSPIPLCYDDGGVLTQAYTREVSKIDNATSDIVSTTIQYSIDGITWTTTAPTGTATLGECVAPIIPPTSIVAVTTRVSWVGASTQTIPISRAWTYTVRTGTVTVDGVQRVAGESFGGSNLSYGNQVVLFPAATIVLAAGAVVDAEWTV